jgi:hypothetical protein
MSVSLDRWIETYARVGSATRRSLEALEAVLTELERRGITCMLLAGADLVPRLYGVWGLRPMADVDLLVRQHDLPAIDRMLRGMGYEPELDGNPAYRAPGGALALDLVTDAWYTDDTDGVWRRAVGQDRGGLRILGMSAEDLVIFLTAYTVLHRGHFVSAFSQDLGLLVRKERLDWEFILAEADRLRLRTPLFHGLSYVAGRAAAVVPADVLARLAPAGTGERLLAFLLRRLVREQPIPDLGHFLLLIPGPGRRGWRRLREAVCPSPEFLQYRYGSRGPAHPVWTRIGRALYLAARAGRLAGKILCRLLAPSRAVRHA